jgi:hypothetical protein
MTCPPRLRLVTDAGNEPVSVTEAKEYCRVDLGDDDALIQRLVSAARRRVEKETGLALTTQTWVAVFDGWTGVDKGARDRLGDWWDGVKEGPISAIVPDGAFLIDKRPFSAVTSIKTLDAYGVLATVDAAIYFTQISDWRGRIMLKLGQTWPTTTLAPMGGIEITFTTGFSSVPDDLRTAIMMLTKHWFDNREPAADGSVAKLPNHVDSIMSAWRPMRLL